MSYQVSQSNSASSTEMTPELLVSVRSRTEAQDAIKMGVDILDWKEPNDGALAPTSVELWQAAASMVQQRDFLGIPKLSVALGESDTAVTLARDVPNAITFAKAGPQDCDHEAALRRLWFDVRQALPDSTILVAVAYADHQAANCLSATEVFQSAAQFGIRHCLLDTFRKDGRSTIDHLGYPQLRALQTLAHQKHLWWSLAGSIRSNAISELARNAIRPHCFGVRGDVCERDRTSRLSQTRLMAWKEAIAATQPTPIPSS